MDAEGLKRRSRTLLGETQCVEAAGQCGDIEVVYNIRYHPELSHDKVSMDVYLPAKSSKFGSLPVVVFMHGGGWQRGDKRRRYFSSNININFGKAMAHRGVICAVVNYRLSRPVSRLLRGVIIATAATALVGVVLVVLSVFFEDISLSSWPYQNLLLGVFAVFLCVALGLMAFVEFDIQRENVKYPTHVHDLAHAMHFIQSSVGEWGGDPSSIFLAGHSSGGHIVSLLALKPSFYEEAGYDQKELVSCVKGVITLSGVFHLGRLNKSIFTRYFFLVPVFGSNKEVYFEASPITYAKQKSPFPMLLLNAQKDFHLARDSKDMVTALKESGSEVMYQLVPKTDHRSILACMNTPNDLVTPIISEFIQKYI